MWLGQGEVEAEKGEVWIPLLPTAGSSSYLSLAIFTQLQTSKRNPNRKPTIDQFTPRYNRISRTTKCPKQSGISLVKYNLLGSMLLYVLINSKCTLQTETLPPHTSHSSASIRSSISADTGGNLLAQHKLLIERKYILLVRIL